MDICIEINKIEGCGQSVCGGLTLTKQLYKFIHCVLGTVHAKLLNAKTQVNFILF